MAIYSLKNYQPTLKAYLLVFFIAIVIGCVKPKNEDGCHSYIYIKNESETRLIQVRKVDTISVLNEEYYEKYKNAGNNIIEPKSTLKMYRPHLACWEESLEINGAIPIFLYDLDYMLSNPQDTARLLKYAIWKLDSFEVNEWTFVYP